MPDHLTVLRDALARAVTAVCGQPPAAVEIVPPARPEHGDLATPVAMSMAKAAKRNPREIADGVAAALLADPATAGLVAGVEVAGPGFINLRMAPAWFAAVVDDALAAGPRYGAGGTAAPEPVLVEFVSVNPTGPLHVGHARQAALGDSVSRILAFAGDDVSREYYVNDYGRQMELFGESVAARYGQLYGLPTEVPEDGYQGDYVSDVARVMQVEVGDGHRERVSPPDDETLALFARRGGELMLDAILAELEVFRVHFDVVSHETPLHDDGVVAARLDELVAAGHAYEQDGALWFRSSAFGDEKDRVLRRANGATTYLAADVAYHLDKARRMGGRMIDVLGADHHGYIGRLKALVEAGGFDPDHLEVLIVQLVSLLEQGEARKMSKRAGTLVTMADLVRDIGVDAARFFLVERSSDTTLDLDLGLAREKSQENPVYYVQYAHARCCSILRKAADEGVERGDSPPPEALGDDERALIQRLADWPGVVTEAAARRAPHRVVAYLKDLARDFHGFYHRSQVVDAAPAERDLRLGLVEATRGVIACGLDLVAVEAPERM